MSSLKSRGGGGRRRGWTQQGRTPKRRRIIRVSSHERLAKPCVDVRVVAAVLRLHRLDVRLRDAPELSSVANSVGEGASGEERDAESAVAAPSASSGAVLRVDAASSRGCAPRRPVGLRQRAAKASAIASYVSRVYRRHPRSGCPPGGGWWPEPLERAVAAGVGVELGRQPMRGGARGERRRGRGRKARTDGGRGTPERSENARVGRRPACARRIGRVTTSSRETRRYPLARAEIGAYRPGG